VKKIEIDMNHSGVLRLPLMSLQTIENLDQKGLIDLAKNPLVRDAILLANPQFFEELTKWVNGEIIQEKRIAKVETTLYNYISRAASRCTPYGLFSTVSFVELGNDSMINSLSVNSLEVHSRLDTKLMVNAAISQEGDRSIRENLRYKSNGSIYFIGNEIRYIDRENRDHELKYSLAKVDNNVYLKSIIEHCANKPRDFIDIINYCCSLGIEEGESIEFIHELITENILLSSLSSLVWREDPLENWRAFCRASLLGDQPDIDSSNFWLHKLTKTYDGIRGKDISDIKSSLGSLISIVQKNNLQLNSRDLIHLDAHRILDSNYVYLEKKLFDKLKDVQRILAKLIYPSFSNALSNYSKRHIERYGRSSVSLLEAMDPEGGIGFKNSGEQSDKPLLLEGLYLPGMNEDDQNLVLNRIEKLLHSKVIQNLTRDDQDEIELKDSELENYPAVVPALTQSVLMCVSECGEKALIKEISGSSAINLIHRFAYLDKQIDELCQEINNFEISECEGAILAEVDHLPEIKSGNLLSHKKLRRFEIPCVTLSDAYEESSTIELNRINIKIDEKDEAVLFDKVSGLRIIPVISNSINFERSGTIDLFRFLGAFQFQRNPGGLYFRWGSLVNLFDNFPRVRYDRFILSPRIWKVSYSEIDDIPIRKENTLETLNKWRISRNIDKKVYFAESSESDYRLFVDFDYALSIESFLLQLKKMKLGFLIEISPIEKRTVSSQGKGEIFNHEIAVPILRSNGLKGVTKGKENINHVPYAVFHPGSEWLYYKLYLGYFSANDLLKNDISKLMEGFIESRVIKKWFFIRYYDHDYHIRLRMHLADNKVLAEIVQKMELMIAKNKKIHSASIDTYQPELERYGIDTMEFCEEIFYYDSLSIIDYQNCTKNDSEYWYFAAIGVDVYFNNFGYSLAEKLEMMSTLSSRFKQEFAVDSKVQLEMDKKYRLYRKRFIDLFNVFGVKTSLSHEETLINCRSGHVKDIVADIKRTQTYKESKEFQKGLVFSLIHMFLNRLFVSNPRKQEMVLYYLLKKHYESSLAIELKSNI
jgi:thiopeptide-type bacteriocin biosynthesis protein